MSETTANITDEIDSTQAMIEMALGAAMDGFEKLAEIHGSRQAEVPEGYRRGPEDVKLYNDVWRLICIVKNGMSEGGISSDEDRQMTKAMKCLGLTWR